MNLSNNMYSRIVTTFIFSLAYAILRYNIFGNVKWEDLPLYVTNKALSLTVVLLLLLSLFGKNKTHFAGIKFWKTIFLITTLHAFISFKLLGPEYYNKFYLENELNITGYLTLFFGIVAFVGILILYSDNLLPTENGKLIIPNLIKRKIRTLIPILTAGHLISMGVLGWLKPYNWYGYLLPISLIAFIAIVAYIYITKQK